jgi:hypothetical protein
MGFGLTSDSIALDCFATVELVSAKARAVPSGANATAMTSKRYFI